MFVYRNYAYESVLAFIIWKYRILNATLMGPNSRF